MDPDTSRKLFAEGAVVIVLDMPIGTEFGIDYNSWNIGPKFKGVKMIPAGPHFVFYSAVTAVKDGDEEPTGPRFSRANPGPRTGFFVHLKKQQILVKQWDANTEELVDGATSAEELARFRMGLMDLDRYLGPYPFDDSLRRWLSLTSNITEHTIASLSPLNGSICSVSTFVQESDEEENEETKKVMEEEEEEEEAKISEVPTEEPTPPKHNTNTNNDTNTITNANTSTTNTNPTDTDMHTDTPITSNMQTDTEMNTVMSADTDTIMDEQPHPTTTPTPTPTSTATTMQPNPDDASPTLTRTHDSVIRFCNIPRRCYPPNASAQEITRCNMDRSYTLDTVLKQLEPQAHAALLGELQFSFVCFLVGHVFDAFEQWKKLVALFCSCEDAITKYPKLFHDFIGVLHYQIREAPSDFFLDPISNNNFLVAVLQTFFAILRESGVNPEVQKRALVFKESLARFSWDFEEEDDDDLPVVVDLS